MGAGDVALVGSGEFTPAMRDVDTELLRRHGTSVVVLATAAAPDGEEVYAAWAAAALRYFADLGGRADVLPVRTRPDALDPAVAARLARADVVYISGGKAPYLCEVLRDTPAHAALVAAWERGGALAGSSAGAEALATTAYDVETDGVPSCPGLALVPHLAVMPHYDAWVVCRSDLVELVRERSSEVTLLGIDEDTALVGGLEEWVVMGAGAVTVFADGTERRYESGATVPLPLLERADLR
jgi:cyanophycinase-like exopeptidase